MVDGNGLENRRGETHREFESRPLRQNKEMTLVVVFCSDVVPRCGLAGFAKSKTNRVVRRSAVQREKHLKGIFRASKRRNSVISRPLRQELQSAILGIMQHFIKNSALVIVAVYALFAAIAGILYVMNSITQAVVTDWLVKGLYVALIFMAFTVIIGFITQRGK